MIHWHEWRDKGRKLMYRADLSVPPLFATREDYATENTHKTPVTLFAQQCVKCRKWRSETVTGDWTEVPDANP